jgi:hypothetical protein
VQAVTDTKEELPTFNLTVADFHTYFVGAAQVWVHNSFCLPDTFIKVGGGFKKNLKSGGTLQRLRDENGGRNWKIVYQDGWFGGEKVSIHYFENEAGLRVYDKTRMGWSNHPN